MKRISKPKKQAIAAKEFALQRDNRGNEKSDTRHFSTSKAVIKELKKYIPQYDKTE